MITNVRFFNTICEYTILLVNISELVVNYNRNYYNKKNTAFEGKIKKVTDCFENNLKKNFIYIYIYVYTYIYIFFSPCKFAYKNFDIIPKKYELPLKGL